MKLSRILMSCVVIATIATQVFAEDISSNSVQVRCGVFDRYVHFSLKDQFTESELPHKFNVNYKQWTNDVIAYDKFSFLVTKGIVAQITVKKIKGSSVVHLQGIIARATSTSWNPIAMATSSDTLNFGINTNALAEEYSVSNLPQLQRFSTAKEYKNLVIETIENQQQKSVAAETRDNLGDVFHIVCEAK